MEKHPLHIKNPELQTTPEVARAVKRKERKTGEKLPNDPANRIDAYMARLESIFLNPDEAKRERNLEMFRDNIYDALIIKRDNFPESYFELQQRIASERGQPVEEIPARVREQMKDVAIEDQKASLDAWIDYLTSEDAVYPAWFKYFVWRNVTKLSQFDKERGEFKKRTNTTVAPYPDIYREPLAQIADLYEKVKADNKNLKEAEIKEGFTKKFPDLYAELIQQSLAAQLENKEETTGNWVKYCKGQKGEAEKLFASLEGKGTGWCTAGRSTAQTQVESGDFYVYYTNDASGEPKQPRLAIRMYKDKIGEVRGILPHQGVEPIMQEVLDEKLQEFGTEADVYKKKSKDMKQLTEIDNKTKAGEALTKDELVFLYEMESPIEGFGYEKDPRVTELQSQRDPEKDAPIVFDCQPEQIAHKKEEITEDTKAYVGPLFDGFFEKVPKTVEHIYTEFPEGKVWHKELKINRDRPMEEQIVDGKYGYVNPEIEKIFTIKGKGEIQRELFVISISETMTTEQVKEYIEKLGLEPAEIEDVLAVGAQEPELQKKYYIVGLGSSAASSDGYRVVPALYDDVIERELNVNNYDHEWFDSHRFLARRKSK